MNPYDDGIPAFPVHPAVIGTEPHAGMKLRDYFAAKAMQGFCYQPADAFDSFAQVAEQAYEMADAMLKARG